MAKNGSEAAGALLNDHVAGHDLVQLYIFAASGACGFCQYIANPRPIAMLIYFGRLSLLSSAMRCDACHLLNLVLVSAKSM